MSAADVQTMAGLDSSGADPVALQTPLYPIIAGFGVLMALATFLPWATVTNPDDGSISESLSGLDAGGWGLSALITGLVIAALGVLGYFWNPFSDPEAMLIAGFSAVAVIASVIKIADPVSLFNGQAIVDYFDADPGIGLWLILATGAASLASGIWIAFSRPRAEHRLT